MSHVHVLNYGEIKVKKNYSQSIIDMAAEAAENALKNFSDITIDALFVSNMLGGLGCNQRMLGALIAEKLGLYNIESYRIETGCGSGGAAIRSAIMAIRSGCCKAALVVGVEKMSTIAKDKIAAALATASNWEKEGMLGESFISLNAKLMKEYVERYHSDADEFGIFGINAHNNAQNNSSALFPNKIDALIYQEAKIIYPPIKLYDASPVCDGAAAVLLVNNEIAKKYSNAVDIVTIVGSAAASNIVALRGKKDLLDLPAVTASTKKSLHGTGLTLNDIDFFELHDAYSIMSVLSLENSGFVEKGSALQFAKTEGIHVGGKLPVSTMGGLKARGHAIGATGIYQLGESCMQLTGKAGRNQIQNPKVGMIQNIGGCGAFCATHILTRYDVNVGEK